MWNQSFIVTNIDITEMMKQKEIAIICPHFIKVSDSSLPVFIDVFNSNTRMIPTKDAVKRMK